MKKTSTLLKVLIPAMLFAGILFQFHEVTSYGKSAPPSGYTGAPSENKCTSCHSGTAKTTGISLTPKNSTPGTYTPGGVADTFTISIKVSSVKGWGFQVTALDSASKKAVGTLATVSSGTTLGKTTISGSTRFYVHHSKTMSGAGSFSVDFEWTPPSSGAGTIFFYVTVNASNSDGSDNGDAIYLGNFKYKELGPPVAKMSVKPSLNVCAGDTVYFADASTNSPNAWSWAFQNGSPSTSSNKTEKVVFKNPGTDTVTLVSSNTIGSSAPLKQVINVYAKPGDSIQVAGNKTSFCNGDSVMLTASTGGTYKWSSGETTQSIYVKKAGSYSCAVTNGGGCMVMSKSVTISVTNPAAPTLVSSKDSICPLQTVTYTAGTGFSNYQFFDGSTSVQNGTSNVYAPTGITASTSITVVGKTSAGCTTSASNAVNVKILSAPTVSLTHGKTSVIYCKDETVNLSATNGMSNYSYWLNGKSLSSGTSNTYSFAASSLNNNDTVAVMVTGSNGCVGVSNIVLSKSASLSPAFSFSSNKLVYDFIDNTTGAVSRSWDFGDGGSATTKSPTHTFANKNTYKVILTTTNADGCKDTVSQFITVNLTGIVQQINTTGSVMVYPNPVQDKLNVAVSSTMATTTQLVLMDMRGNIISRQENKLIEGNNVLELNTSGMAAGIYMLQLISNENIYNIRVQKSAE